MENELTLSEKLLLLAIRPEKGGIFLGTLQALDFCMIGALLLEMNQSGSISIQNNRVEPVKETAVNPLHAYLLEKIKKGGRPRKIGHWLEPFVLSGKKIKAELYRSLSEKRQIRLEDKKFLFFTWKKPFLSPSNQTWRLIDNLKNLMYKEPEKPEDLLLAALLEPAELWRRAFDEWRKRRDARRKIRQYLETPRFSEAPGHTAEAAKAVVRAISRSVSARRAAAT